jgi:hypothetical protein
MAATFRALAEAGGGALSDRVAQFANAAREAVTSGIAASNPVAFAAELRRAGDLLARAGSAEEDALAAELDALTTAIRALQPGPPVAPPRAPVPTAPPIPQSAAPRVADDSVPETADLVGSWAMYQRLAQGGIGPASLEELIAGAGRVPPPAPSRDTARPAPAPAPAPAAAVAPLELPVVDVRTLLYRGDRALKRAQELRETAKQASSDTLRALVDEVCDLVALALEPSPPPPSRPNP